MALPSPSVLVELTYRGPYTAVEPGQMVDFQIDDQLLAPVTGIKLRQQAWVGLGRPTRIFVQISPERAADEL